MRTFSPHAVPIFLGAMLVVGCTVNTDRAAIEKYMTDMEPIADVLSVIGTQIENITTETDPTQWTDAELQQAEDAENDLKEQIAAVEAITVPAPLADVHPLLVDGLQEMEKAMAPLMINDYKNNPSMFDEEMAKDMMESVQRGEALLDQYINDLNAVLQEKYPDLIQQ